MRKKKNYKIHTQPFKYLNELWTPFIYIWYTSSFINFKPITLCQILTFWNIILLWMNHLLFEIYFLRSCNYISNFYKCTHFKCANHEFVIFAVRLNNIHNLLLCPHNSIHALTITLGQNRLWTQLIIKILLNQWWIADTPNIFIFFPLVKGRDVFKFLEFLVPNVFPSSSQYVTQAPNVFLNMLPIAPHFVP